MKRHLLPPATFVPCITKCQFVVNRYLFCPHLDKDKAPAMNLKMFLGNELIDAVKINAYQLTVPGYIEVLKMEMEEKNEEILDLSNEEPKFFIDSVASSMNSKKFQRID
jgi:hypothetical protein